MTDQPTTCSRCGAEGVETTAKVHTHYSVSYEFSAAPTERSEDLCALCHIMPMDMDNCPDPVSVHISFVGNAVLRAIRELMGEPEYIDPANLVDAAKPVTVIEPGQCEDCGGRGFKMINRGLGPLVPVKCETCWGTGKDRSL